VRHLEKVASESIFGQQMDAWDVRTNKNRWWVITNPINFYSQRLFPSLDYTLSFHVGMTTRVMQSEMSEEHEYEHDHIIDFGTSWHERVQLFFLPKRPKISSPSA